MFSRQIAPVSRSRCAHGCGTTANVQHTLEQRAHELQAQLEAAEAEARARPTRSAAEIAKEAEMARELHELRRQNGALGAEAEASKDTLRGLSSQIRTLHSQIAKSDAQTSADERAFLKVVAESFPAHTHARSRARPEPASAPRLPPPRTSACDDVAGASVDGQGTARS